MSEKERDDCHAEKVTIEEERIGAKEYIEFLHHTDLGSQYPKERFAVRIATLVSRVPISLVARNSVRQIVGVCFGITDFAYWLFITDLGVDRGYVKQGIGHRLLERALEAAGGKQNIILYTCANKHAVPFYEKMGMVTARDVMVLDEAEWTSFTVGE